MTAPAGRGTVKYGDDDDDDDDKAFVIGTENAVFDEDKKESCKDEDKEVEMLKSSEVELEDISMVDGQDTENSDRPMCSDEIYMDAGCNKEVEVKWTMDAGDNTERILSFKIIEKTPGSELPDVDGEAEMVMGTAETFQVGMCGEAERQLEGCSVGEFIAGSVDDWTRVDLILDDKKGGADQYLDQSSVRRVPVIQEAVADEAMVPPVRSDGRGEAYVRGCEETAMCSGEFTEEKCKPEHREPEMMMLDADMIDRCLVYLIQFLMMLMSLCHMDVWVKTWGTILWCKDDVHGTWWEDDVPWWTGDGTMVDS